MKIDHYVYDDIANPRCGGGGALRERQISQAIAHNHTIRFYTGHYAGAKKHVEGGVTFRHLGFGNSYLLSRITFAIAATIHSLFSSADLIVIGFSVYSPVLTFLFKPKRCVVQFYHFVEMEPFVKYGPFGFFAWAAERIFLLRAQNIITLAESVATKIRAQARSLKRIIPGYVSFDETLLLSSPEDSNFILSLGRIDIRMKGHDLLLDAFDAIAPNTPQYRLIIAGRGTENDITWIKNRIAVSPFINRIELIINPADEAKKELLRTCTLAVMPSRYEGWNIVAIEAAANCKATIGTRIPGLMDAISDGKTGILVAPNDKTALANAMTKLLNQTELRTTYGSNGRNFARQFTLERIAKLQEDFYFSVAGIKPGQ